MKIELDMYELMDLLEKSPFTGIDDNFITISISQPGYFRGDIEIRMTVKHGQTHETMANYLNLFDFQNAKEETKKEVLEYILNKMTNYFAKEVFGCYTNPTSK